MSTIRAGLFGGLVAGLLLTIATPSNGQVVPNGVVPLRPGVGYSVSVVPDGGTAQYLANSGQHTLGFSVINTGIYIDSYTLTCSSTGGISCVSVSPPSLSHLEPHVDEAVDVTFTVGASGGTLTLTATGAGVASDNGYYLISVTAGPAPTVNLSQYNPNNQDISRCAVDCFAAAYEQSTVPYISLDTPRNITLVYNGDRVDPRPFIHVDVKHSGSLQDLPQEFHLSAKVNGTSVTFLNSEQTLKFAGPTTLDWYRLGGQFRAATNNAPTTGARTLQITVGAKYAAGVVYTTTTTTLVVLHEDQAAVARGWTLAGVQRAYVSADASVLIADGDGSVVRFVYSGGVYQTPSGEFSDLVAYGNGWRRDYPDSSHVYFNATGRMTDVYDQSDNHTQFGYDGLGRLNSITDPVGKSLVLAYGANGLASVRSSITPYRYSYFTVAGDSTLRAIRDPDGDSTAFGYDASRRLTTITDRRGNVTALTYHNISGVTSNKVARVTLPSVTLYTGSSAAPADTVSPWHLVGVPYTSTATTPAALVRTDGAYARIADAAGHVTLFTVDPWGQPLAVIDPVGDTTNTRYDVHGLPIRVVSSADPTAVDTAAYNGNGFPTYMRPAGGTATTVTYNSTWVTQADSTVTSGLPTQRFWIGINGRVDSVRTGSVHKVRYAYDAQGRVIRITDALGAIVQRTGYAGTNGNRSADTIPGNRVTTYGYDAYGRNTTVSAPGFAVRTTHYDVLNRPDSVRDGVNPAATRYTYDDASNVVSVRDPKGQIYGFEYNALGWMTAKTDPAGKADELGYDVEGRVREWKNRRGQTTQYSYDALHRRTGKGGANTDSTTFAYSANGREITAQSRAGSGVIVTDTVHLSTLGLVDSTTTNFGSFSRTRRYGYTAAGVVDSVWVEPYYGNTFLGRKYFFNSSRGTLDSLRIGGRTSKQAFDANLRNTLRVNVGGDTVSQTYLSWGPPSAMQAHAPSFDVLSRSLEYNSGGRIRHQFTEPIPVQFSRLFGYDDLGRVRADTGGMVEYDTCTYDEAYGWVCPDLTVDSVRTLTYDAVGNVLRDSIWRGWGLDTAVTASYDSASRITNFNGCDYSTDADGNITARACTGETVVFWWSSDNRLDSLAVNGAKTYFQYDGFGRLVKRVSGGATRFFWWDSDNLYAELDGNGAKLTEYSYAGLDSPHAIATADSTVYFTHVDGLGNVVGLVSHTGVLQYSNRDYDLWGATGAWGNLPGGATNRVRFKGALWMGDVGTDLYYMRARWYEPETGRFLSEDPIGLAGGINPYVFAGNDAVNLGDPTGLYLHRIKLDGGGFADPESRAWDMIDATNPYDVPGYGDWPGVGSGGGGGAATPTVNECLRQAGYAALIAAIDITPSMYLLKGLGAVGRVGAVLLKRRSFRQGMVRMTREGLEKGMRLHGDLVFARASRDFNLKRAFGGSPLGWIKGEAKTLGASIVGHLQPSSVGEFVGGLVPGISGVLAVGKAGVTCYKALF